MPSMDSNASKAFAAAAAVGAGVAAVYCVKKCFATGKNPLSNFEFVEPQVRASRLCNKINRTDGGVFSPLRL